MYELDKAEAWAIKAENEFRYVEAENRSMVAVDIARAHVEIAHAKLQAQAVSIMEADSLEMRRVTAARLETRRMYRPEP